MNKIDPKLIQTHIKRHPDNDRKWCKYCRGKPLPVDSSSKGSGQHTPKYEWVSVREEEHGGRPYTPKAMVDSTALVRYDPSKHTDMNFFIRRGAGPQGEMITQYKIYYISKFDMDGFRLTAMAAIEFPAWRQYEEDWVNALNGAFVQIDDPGLAGVVSKKYRMKVTHTDFHKKSTFRGDHYTLEGSITMKEHSP